MLAWARGALTLGGSHTRRATAVDIIAIGSPRSCWLSKPADLQVLLDGGHGGAPDPARAGVSDVKSDCSR